MRNDDGPATQHAGRVSGISAGGRLVGVGIVAFIAGAIALAALGDGGGPSTVSVAEPTRADPSPTEPPATPSPRPTATVAPPVPGRCVSPTGDPWRANACDHRADVGQFVEYTCPAGGVPAEVWGATVYTDDSSVCGAGVHAGALTTAEGGTVAISILPGRSGYVGRVSNGITSLPWEAWGGSYEINGYATPVVPDCPLETMTGDAWRMTACMYRGNDDAVLTYACPRGGPLGIQPGPVWGNVVYTDDSAVCVAAVHAGALTSAEGGSARIVIRPGRDAYDGTTRNGVTTIPFQAWPGSFEVLLD